ncbi:hypothetical protein LJC11_03340 [Bacteroidales bacterium OttesenSCG-928-I21]|nr:hypothetical protein [Bacteroidales bacterium OttesenSCG-928-I21]
MTTKKSDIKIVINLVIIGIILFFVHFLVIRAIPNLNVPEVLYIHPFILILTIITILALNFILKKIKPNLMGYTFLASSFVKMMLAILFLIPILNSNFDYKKIYIVQFFIVYFVYLAMEVVYLVQKIKNK